MRGGFACSRLYYTNSRRDEFHRRLTTYERCSTEGHPHRTVDGGAEGGIAASPGIWSDIANTAGALDRLMRKLRRARGVWHRLCLRGGARALSHTTSVVDARERLRCGGAVADRKRAGDRVKKDRWMPASPRGRELAPGGRADAGWVRTPGHEAMRDLVRDPLDGLQAFAGPASSLSGLFCCARAAIWAAGLAQAAFAPTGSKPGGLKAQGGRGSRSSRGAHHRARGYICSGRSRRALGAIRLTAQIAAICRLDVAPVVAALNRQCAHGALVNAAR